MKKSNLAILLLAPFVIAFLGIVSVNAAFSLIDKDIEGIDWDYQDREAFKITGQGYLLKATPVTSEESNLAYGNELVWSIDKGGEDYAYLKQEKDSFYLYPEVEGEITLTCSNKKGNVHRSRKAILYKNSAILFIPEISSSQNNLDSTLYYGEYDLDKDGNKTSASFVYHTKVVPEDLSSTLRIEEQSDNISYDVSSGKRTVLKEGAAYLKRSCGYSSSDSSENTLSFTVVDDGVNVYDYDGLRKCTNLSKDGEKVVLRKNFDSLKNVYERDKDGKVVLKDSSPVLKSGNTTLFGNYDSKSGKTSFTPYTFVRNDSHEFIDKWNAYAKENPDKGLAERGDTLLSALHVQKDFYGNGYKRNFHDLIYPSRTKEVNSDGTSVSVPALGKDDLFRGPSYAYALGDPKNRPLIAIYGQDNCGVYVDKDGVTIDDVDIRNCDTPSSLSFLKTCGSVRDVEADHVSLLYSRLSCGKNVLRSFSSRDRTVKNTRLSNARNFLIDVGTNEYRKLDGSKTSSFLQRDGNSVTSTLDDYLNGQGDSLMGSYFTGDGDKDRRKKCLNSLWAGRSQTDGIKDVYKGSRTIDNCYFYQSGISSIGIESVFEGTYRYNNTPSTVNQLLTILGGRSTGSGSSRIPFVPKDRFGVSYPVKVKIQGKSRFYDYKEIGQRDITGLIEENFSTIFASLPDARKKKIYERLGKDPSTDDVQITIDDFFPFKPALNERAKSQGCVYQGTKEGSEKEGEYRNIPVAYYGGGINLSTVDRSEREEKDHFKESLPLDLLQYYLNHGSGVHGLLYKMVSFFTGFEPFKFVRQKADGEWFSQAPNVSDLKK